MPRTMPSTELHSRYSDVADYCRTHDEPVFITEDGIDNLVVMSMQTYERRTGILELRHLLEEGGSDVDNGNVFPAAETFAELEREIFK